MLAVALLNAHQRPIESYYGLESLLPPINDRLADPALTGTLADADQATIDAVARLFGILDEKRPKRVSLTKLSKVLHRKRPELLSLYDKNIWQCYAKDGLIPKNRNRSWHDYSQLLVAAMKHDLSEQMIDGNPSTRWQPNPESPHCGPWTSLDGAWVDKKQANDSSEMERVKILSVG